MAKTDTSITSRVVKQPNYISIILLSLLSLSMAGLLAWKQFGEYMANTTPETFQWLLISGLCALGSLLLVVWIIARLIWKVVRLRKIRQAHEGNIEQLNTELQTGLRELEIQQEMQQACFTDHSSTHIMELAGELLRAQNVSYWRLTAEDTQMECLNALKDSKSAYDQATIITKEQYPSLFRLLLDKTCIQYPQAKAEEGEEPQKLGNLLHYIENNQVKCLLIIPLEIDGNIVGAAWFEHREETREWSIRDQNQAHFVATIIRMQFYKNIQHENIQDLSEVILQFDNFRSNANFGLCWFQLASPIAVEGNADQLAEEIAQSALLEEANDEATSHFLREASFFLGSPIQEHLPAGLLHTFVTNDFQVTSYEWEHQHRGERRVLVISLYGIRVHGKLAGVWLVSNDITAIKEKEWETSTLLNNAAGVLTLLDQENKIIFDSASIQQLGYQMDSRVGKELTAYLFPTDVPIFEQAIQEVLQAGKPDQTIAQVRMKTQEADWHYFQVQLKNLANEAHADGILVEMHNVDVQLETMRKQEEKISFLDSLIKYGDEVIMVLAQDGSISYESENAKRIIGYTADERIGKFGFEYFHQRDMEDLEKAFVKLKEGKIAGHRQDIQFLHRDGNWRDMEFYMSKNAAGQFVSRLKDVSHEKKNEVMRANREALLQTFLNSSEKLYVLTNSKGKIKYASGSFEEQLGVPAERLVGSYIGKLILADERDAFVRNLEVLVQDKQARIQMYIHLPTATDELRYFSLKSHGHLLEKAYSGLLLELEPIQLTNEKGASLALKADFFQSLANSFPSPLFFLDQQYDIKFANSAANKLLEQPLSGNFLNLIESANQQETKNWLQHQQAAGIDLLFQGNQSHKAQLFELQGSKLKGMLIYIRRQDPAEVQELQRSYTTIEQLQTEVSQLRAELAAVETDEALQEKLSAYRQQLTDLLDEVAQLKEGTNQTVAHTEQEALRAPIVALLDAVDQTRTVISKYQEITPGIDVTAKLAEIHNFSELINFDMTLEETKTYINQIKSALNIAEVAKG